METTIKPTVPNFHSYSLQLHNVKSGKEPKTKDLWEFQKIFWIVRESQNGAKWRNLAQMFHQMFNQCFTKTGNGETFAILLREIPIKNNEL